MKKLVVLSTFVVITLLATQFASIAFAAPPDDKGPPTFEKMVFIHYRSDFAPGKPIGTPVKPSKTPSLYVYNKIHWPYDKASAGIDWYYNPENSPGTTNYEEAIVNSFVVWDDVPDTEANIDFNYISTTDVEPGWGQYATYDGRNVVGWDNISSDYSGAIGVTITWYYRLGKDKIIVECDTVLNTDLEFEWAWVPTVIDDNQQLAESGKYDVDVQNIMTHEAGHWLMLGDMYDTVAVKQTMFGIAYDRELNKRTLEDGDKAGINTIY